jgi:hypothetical protein
VIFFLQTHLTFGKEFTQAVELKQVAQQDAEKARFLVEKVSIMRISIRTSYLEWLQSTSDSFRKSFAYVSIKIFSFFVLWTKDINVI